MKTIISPRRARPLAFVSARRRDARRALQRPPRRPDAVAEQHSERLSPAPSDRAARGSRAVDDCSSAAMRGDLTPAQRADVACLRPSWQREATGGIVIDVAGRHAERACRRERCTRNPLDPRSRPASPAAAIVIRAVSAAGPDPARADPLNYPRMTAEAGPCGLWPNDLGPTLDPIYWANNAVLESRLRLPAQSRRHGRRSGRSRAAARRDAALRRAPHAGASTSTARARAPRPLSGCRQRQDQRRRQMIKFHSKAATERRTRRAARRTSTSRRCRASRSRRSARPPRPPPPCRPRAKIAAWPRPMCGCRWAASPAALEAYRASPTPNVIDHRIGRAAATSCSTASMSWRRSATPAPASSSIGRLNDIVLYRELIRRGVSDYLIAPVGTGRSWSARSAGCSPRPTPSRSAARSPWSAPRAASAPRRSRTTSPGRSRATCISTSVVADLDLPFGTAGLDFNQDPPQGIADAVFSPDRIDTALRRPPAVEMHRPPEPAGRAGDARPGLRFRRRGVRPDLRHAARDRALHRARRAASCGPAGPGACWSAPTTS